MHPPPEFSGSERFAHKMVEAARQKFKRQQQWPKPVKDSAGSGEPNRENLFRCAISWRFECAQLVPGLLGGERFVVEVVRQRFELEV